MLHTTPASVTDAGSASTAADLSRCCRGTTVFCKVVRLWTTTQPRHAAVLLHVLMPTCHGGHWLPSIIHLVVQVKEHIILQSTATAPVSAMPNSTHS